MNNFGNRVSGLRKHSGFTQAVMADKMNISLHTYRKLEYHSENPTMITVKKLLVIFDVTLEELFPELCDKSKGLSKPEKELLSNFHQLKPAQQDAVLRLVQSFL